MAASRLTANHCLLPRVEVPDAVLPTAGIVQGAYDDVTAAVGDVLSFSYTEGYHDVMLIQDGNDECDFSGGSLLILGYAELTCEALMAITVFEGCMIISGAVAGNVVLDEAAGQSWVALSGYTASFIVILIGLGVLFKGELAPPPSLL